MTSRQNQTLYLLQFEINRSLVHVCFVLFIVGLYICVCERLLQNNNHKQNIKIILLQNNIHVSEIYCRSAVRFGQALSGYPITAHHLCVSLL